MLQRFHTNRSRASRSLFGDVILEVLEIDAIAETELKKKLGNRGGGGDASPLPSRETGRI